MADGVFDVVPKYLPADQLRHIGPDLVAGVGELDAQPEHKIILLGIGMANEDETPRGSGTRRFNVRRVGHGATLARFSDFPDLFS